MKMYVVGAGPGKREYLTGKAESIIAESDLVIAPKRLCENLSVLNTNLQCIEIKEVFSFIRAKICEGKLKSMCLMVSGDTGFYSIAKRLSTEISDLIKDNSCEIIFECGISSIQYFASKLGTSYDDTEIISLHGKDFSITPYVCYNPRVLALTGGVKKAGDIIKEIIAAGLSDVKISVGENLSNENERIITGTAIELSEEKFDDLAVILIENSEYVNFYENIYDSEIIRGKRPMTKENVKNISVSSLNIKPKDTIIDIGGGTGAVSLTLARKAFQGMVYTVECEPEGTKLINANREKFGAYNIKVIKGRAPEALVGLPKFDKAFIGGSNGNLKEIINLLIECNSNIDIVINAVTLETLAEAKNSLIEAGLTVNVICITVATGQVIGEYTMMKGENPVYIIKGERNE